MMHTHVQHAQYMISGTRLVTFLFLIDRIHASGSHVEEEVFKCFYAKLVKVLPVVDNIYTKLVPEGILDPDDIEEINHMPRSDRKASIVLRKISSSLQAGKTDSFYRLLEVMETSLNDDVKALIKDIRGALVTGKLLYKVTAHP